MCKYHATHRALFTCNMSCATWYVGTAIKFDRVCIYFSFILLAEPSTDEGGEETKVLEKASDDKI